MVEALLFKTGVADAEGVNFDALILRFSASHEWTGAVWEWGSGSSTAQFPAARIEEISSASVRFDATVIDGFGVCHGPFSIQTVICGFPSHTFCFLFYIDADGMWSGHTVAQSFGRIVVVPYRTDPT